MQVNKIFNFSVFFLCLILLHACNSTVGSEDKKILTPTDIINANIDSIKRTCRTGDLITRLNDDMLSEFIKELAVKDFFVGPADLVADVPA